jgi:hypothetical protein
MKCRTLKLGDLLEDGLKSLFEWAFGDHRSEPLQRVGGHLAEGILFTGWVAWILLLAAGAIITAVSLFTFPHTWPMYGIMPVLAIIEAWLCINSACDFYNEIASRASPN